MRHDKEFCKTVGLFLFIHFQHGTEHLSSAVTSLALLLYEVYVPVFIIYHTTHLY